MSGGTAGGFVYAALSASVTLDANTSYLLMSSEVVGGDTWSDDIPSTNITLDASIATLSSSVYQKR